jgi:hypothetical protein
LQKQLQAISKLKADYPHLDFDKEQAFFESCLLER